MKKIIFIFASLQFLISCGESKDVSYDRGFDDGYAIGFNTTCEIRSTLIAGDWDNKHYSDGYRDGYQEGSLDCKRQEE